MTNIIEMLHTTAAYQAAVLQLMVGEAESLVNKLALPEPLPIRVTLVESNRYSVLPPPLGVGGSVTGQRYSFTFESGNLGGLRKMDWYKQTFTNGEMNAQTLAPLKSLIDTNSAYQLATQFLARLDVDIAAVERQFPRHVNQWIWRRVNPSETNTLLLSAELRQRYGVDSRPSRRSDASEPQGPANIPTPIFDITWGPGTPPFISANPIRVKVLGHTREVVEATLQDPRWIMRSPLVVTNAAVLLGPLPSPRKFVTDLFGGPDEMQAVEFSDRVEITLVRDLGSNVEGGPARIENRTTAKATTRKQAERLGKLLTEFNSYNWKVMKMCGAPDFGVRLLFHRAQSVPVEVLLCFQCDELEVRHGSFRNSEHFDSSSGALLEIARAMFPYDSALRKEQKDRRTKESHEGKSLPP